MTDDTTQYVVLFGVQAFGPFDSRRHARYWMAQSDLLERYILGKADIQILPLTKPEMDEEVRA